MTKQGVLLDTSFFIRLMDERDPLHLNALGYFKYFLENDYELFISTIAIAEYCVRGEIDELPLKNLRVLPFNLEHARRSGIFAEIIFKEKGKMEIIQRAIIPNDTKLFAQANQEKGIAFYLTSDSESKKIYHLLQKNGIVNFAFIDLNIPYHEAFGILDL
ncbi:type II toxin-antitoxin system VapC family toxin [Algoriphagus formosus]|uniref:type II toxin-antitoxin system VapC family toxin n=1 Tax=Algoriphagus formosus TaxID=2007308 RepID=UPI000C286D6D|nr:PIN domain-containing protein [Algoriphagus formosus]